MLRIVLLAGLLSASISLNLSAQDIVRTLDSSFPRIYHTSSLQTSERSPTEKSYIVQFEGLPLLIQGQNSNKQAGSEPALLQAAFKSDLNRIASSNGLPVEALAVRDVYASVFNGALVTLTESAASEVRQLPYVRRVIEDGTMQAAHNIRRRTHTAEQGSIRAEDGEYTGSGIVVAVIDSGVDYTHPDLSGGYLGGYDYVNDDPDPMDDNGHGTHVAGIVAGNGAAFKGTAPDVQFIALKVLDSAGRGFDSAVLSAIEHAVNPDGDPSTNDAVDIINLSLSSLEIGMADHPVTIAVENAIAAGVVCVVAAGNRGEEGRASITAPGNASNAITVGATDSQDEVASFSSQGPSGSIHLYSVPFFGLKPDILAPGVQIQSTWLNGGYEVRDGTSMASPYVAGIVAQMIQEFPDWDPITIKAHLMQQTKDLGESIWSQGAGKVDRSNPLPFVVSPACMDLGLVYSSQNNWERSESLSITNLGTSASTYEIRVRDSLPEGIMAAVSHSAITLEPGESLALQLDILVQPDILPVSSFPDGYVGHIDVEGGTRSVSIPFSIFKNESARIQLTDNADHIVLQGKGSDGEHIYANASNLTSLFVPPNTYDVLVQFNDGKYTIIKEAANLQEAAFFEIDKSEAIYPVTVKALDINQDVLSPLSFEMYIQGANPDWALSNYLDPSIADAHQTLYFSSFTEAYTVDFSVSAFSSDNDYYELPFALQSGLDGDVILENDVEALKRFQYQYALPDGVNEAYFIPWSTRNASINPFRFDDLAGFAHPGYQLNPPFEKVYYTASGRLNKHTERGFGHSIVHQVPGSSQKLADQQTLIRTSPMFLRGDSALITMNGQLHLVQESQSGGYELYPGTGEGFWAGELDNSATRIRLKGAANGGFFLGEWGEAFKGAGEWVLLQDEAILDHETLLHTPEIVPDDDLLSIERTVEPGAYTLIIRNEAFLSGLREKGHAVELSFKTDRADPDPPRLQALYGRLNEAGEEELVIAATDVCNWCSAVESREHLDSVKLWVKRSPHDVWEEQLLSVQDSVYIASFDGAYTERYHALRVMATDIFENSIDYYSVDESDTGISDPKAVGLDQSLATPAGFEVASLYPNPSTGPVRLTYNLSDPTDVEIMVYNMLGRNVLHVSEHQVAGTHEHLLDFHPFANGLYVIQVKAGEYNDVRQVLKIR